MGAVLSGDAFSLTYCSVRVFRFPPCRPVREKLRRFGTFVSYSLAVCGLSSAAHLGGQRGVVFSQGEADLLRDALASPGDLL